MIIKRDGAKVPFDKNRIYTALQKAFESVGIKANGNEVQYLTDYVTAIFDDIAHNNEMSVEEIQDMIEKVLMSDGYSDVARAYVLYRENRTRARAQKQPYLDYKETMEKYLKIEDWRVKENSTVNYSLGGLILGNSGAMTANYWLSEVYDNEIADAHRNCDLHIHDLSMLSPYCAGWSLRQLLEEGLGGVPGKISSKPAAHLSTLCNQMVNFLGILQNEWAGAQAFSSFDTYLAPFVRVDSLSYDEVKQCIQSFVFGLNTPSRWGCQSPFVNITLDWVVPEDLKDLPAIVGGKEMDFTYGDCQKEVDIINKAFIEVMLEGDADGRGFQYPIPTYSITKDFDWSETENNKLLFEMTSKYGTPYFSNYINSDMEPSDVRSMCPLAPNTRVLVRIDGEVFVEPISRVAGIESSQKLEVWTPEGWRKARPHQQNPTPTYTLYFSDGSKVIMGEHHLQPTYDKGVVFAKHLTTDDWLPFLEVSNNDIKRGYCAHDMTYKKIKKIIVNEDNNTPLYCFEVDNDSHLFTLANGLITHNCRLRLDLRELRRKAGGYFGSGESTGSINVVTINMPRLAYLSENEREFYSRLNHLMDIAARCCDIKRKTLVKLLGEGLYPYTKRYLGSFDNHFSTIGLIGMNEAGLNASWLKKDLTHPEAQKFAKEVLNYMRERLSDYQEKYGCLFNLEATPAESTTYRFAKHDKEQYPDIITATEPGDTPYYTNSSHLPVGFTEDIFTALDMQDELQTLYTSGTVFHAFLGEKLPDWKAAANLVRTIAENYKLPYFTLSPTYSVCKNHGYLNGEHFECPNCGENAEVYSRITGYYRPIQNWNDGKVQEYKERKEYNVG